MQGYTYEKYNPEIKVIYIKNKNKLQISQNNLFKY